MAKSVSIRVKLAMGSNIVQMGQMSGAAGALKMLAASLTNFSAETVSAALRFGFVTVIVTAWMDRTKKIVKVNQVPSASQLSFIAEMGSVLTKVTNVMENQTVKMNRTKLIAQNRKLFKECVKFNSKAVGWDS